MGNDATESLAARIGAIRSSFEESLLAGAVPDIRAWLHPWRGAQRAALFRLLLAVLIRHEQKSGRGPQRDEYRSSFPEFSQIVDELFDGEEGIEETRSYLLAASTDAPASQAAPRRVESAAHPWPPTVGRYRVLGELARGGMGAVLRAHDPELNRLLAIKVMLPGIEHSRDAVDRFWQEARITAQLQHPGLPPMHDVGTLPNDRPYIAMKLIEGNSLAGLLKNRQDPADDLPRFVAIFESICQSVAYAHTQGVVHRDLKPANVMVGEFGEVQVMDWGLAKRLRTLVPESHDPLGTAPPERPDLTSPGAVAGTPAFMPPEQACGLNDAVDERADVFGLAAILCVILTGRPPYVAATRSELLEKCCTGDVGDALQALDQCQAPPDLIAIARQGLAREPDLRQRDAREMADAVSGYRASVERELQLTRMQQAAAEARAAEKRKRRMVWGLFGAAALLIAGMVGFGSWWWYRDQRNFDAAALSILTSASEQVTAAREASADPHRMGTLLEVARTRLDELGSQVRSGRSLDAGSADRLQSLWEELSQTTNDQAALAAFRASRKQATRISAGSGHYLDQEAMTGLWNELRRIWLSPESIEPRDLAESLRSRHPEVARQLTGLLQFLLVSTADRKQVDWVLETLTLLDDRAERRTILESVAHGELHKIRTEMDDLSPEDYSPEFLFAMAQQMPDSPDKLQFLRKAKFAWLNDFWLNHLLGNSCEAATREAENRDNAALLNGLHVEAISCLNAAAALEPDNAGNHVNLGLALLQWGDANAALKSFTKATELEPHYGGGHAMRGVALMQLERSEEGVEAFQTAIRVAPNFAPGYSYLARWHAQNDRMDEALPLLRRAVELNPTSDAHFELGKALGAMDQIDASIAEWKEATRIDSDHALAHFASGLAHLDRREWSSAIESLENARRCEPKDVETLFQLGNAYFGDRQLEPARQCWSEVLAIDDLRGEAHAQLGIVLFQLGQKPEAIGHWLRAHDLGAGSPNTRVYIAIELAALGRVDEAKAACQQALVINPSFSNAWYTLSELQAFQGDLDEAIASLQRVMESEDPLRPPLESLQSQMAKYERDRELKAEQGQLIVESDFPADPALLLDLARISEDWNGQHHLAARLYERRFSPDMVRQAPILPTQRFFAACSAAMAAAELHDDRRIAAADGERLKCRRLALDWMSAELEFWNSLYPTAPPESRSTMQSGLNTWLSESRLASVREPEELQRLPAQERQRWESFWQSTRQFLSEISDAPY